MRYQAMAKHYLYERLMESALPQSDDGSYLEHGKEFTPAELDKFRDAVTKEILSQRAELEKAGIIIS
jgi:hypothetical protein